MLAHYLNQNLIFGVVGGIGLLLFGMKTMSEGLQKVAGDRMRKVLASLTSNRLVGSLVGLGLAAVIQSSSATTVMVVGFVNAGLMTLVQAIGVILGANIGTTVTAQLIAFKIGKLALPAIGLGVGLKFFAHRKSWAYLGEIFLGFGLLFLGLEVLQGAFEPFKGSSEFREMLLAVGDHHLLGVLIGTVITLIVQSSSATIGITIALASSGLLSFEASIALILGENIGATITANLAAVGTNLAARRTAFVHFFFNVVGVGYMLLFFSQFMHFIDSVTPGAADFVIQTQQQAVSLGGELGDKPFIARHIANTHTLFNLVNTLVFLPLVGWLARLATLLIRGHDTDPGASLRFIDHRVLNTPTVALAQARAEIRHMAQLTLEMLKETILFLRDQEEKRLPILEEKELAVDLLQKEITDFLVALGQKSISLKTSQEIVSLMQMASDLERIGDHCQNLWRLGQRQRDQRIRFSGGARGELEEMAGHCQEFLSFVVAALDRGDRTILERAEELENLVDGLEGKLRNNHIRRLNTGECGVMPGLIFIDLIHNYEKVADHTFKVAAALVGRN